MLCYPLFAVPLACLLPLLRPAPPDAAFQDAPAPITTVQGSQARSTKPKVDPAYQEYQHLKRKVDLARMDFYKKQRAAMEKAQREGGKIPAMPMSQDFSEWTPKFLAGAKKYARTDGAIPFLTYILDIEKDMEVIDQVISTLLQDHAESKRMASLASGLRYRSRKIGKENTNKLLHGLLEKSPHDLVKASVHYALGTMRLANSKISDEDKRKAYDELRLAIQLAPKTRIAIRAEGILYEARYLQIGMKAPDIEGEDTDGVAFKLSDYKGKVIMLDFWGDW